MATSTVVVSAISALAAGTTATLATVLIEKLGGSIGGVLASSPSTIVIFAVATAVSADSQTDLITTLYFSAVGLFGDAVFLWLWRVLPAVPWFARHVHDRSRLNQAVVMTMVTIGFWMVYAIVLIFSSQALLNAGVPNRVIGCLFWAANVAFGLYTVLYRYVPPPRLERQTSHLAYLGRFCLGACSIGISIGISSISPVAGGVGSMFPNTFLASMFTLWVLHGAKLPHSAIGPLMLGAVSSPFYAAMFGELLPLLSRSLSFVPALVVTAFLSEGVAITAISLPVYHIVRWRIRKEKRTNTSISQDDAAGREFQNVKAEDGIVKPEAGVSGQQRS